MRSVPAVMTVLPRIGRTRVIGMAAMSSMSIMAGNR